MEAKKENILGTERIGKLLLSYSIPGIISMLVNSIYNMVDQIFIGQGVGYLGNAATNVVFPFSQIMMALSIMVAAGTAANVGLNLGKKREEEANHFVGTGFCLAAINGLAVLLVAELLMPVLLRVFGATDLVMPYAMDYGRIVLI
ncbi:MAG: MATE family efflux transporter, partial [Lachnospiraceae bacterium]|nr:MATE family efflux transporter [Lachnospiraceae bacterium]